MLAVPPNLDPFRIPLCQIPFDILSLLSAGTRQLLLSLKDFGLLLSGPFLWSSIVRIPPPRTLFKCLIPKYSSRSTN